MGIDKQEKYYNRVVKDLVDSTRVVYGYPPSVRAIIIEINGIPCSFDWVCVSVTMKSSRNFCNYIRKLYGLTHKEVNLIIELFVKEMSKKTNSIIRDYKNGQTKKVY
jgi:hypothetical protein